jgi:hypothetical protein
MRHNFVDMTGRQFGQWTVTARAQDTKRRGAQWLCVCTCGTERVVDGWSLRAGNATGCGCMQWVKAQKTAKARGKTLFIATDPPRGRPRSLRSRAKGSATQRAKRTTVSLAPVRLPE